MFRLILFVFLGGIIYLWWKYPHRFRPTFWRRWLMPAIVSFLALVYAGSPIDLVPDVPPFGFIDDIIVLVTAFWWIRQRLERVPLDPDAQREPEHKPTLKRERWDPYAVLGIKPGASRDQVAQAYRDQMKLYHPDRVAELGEDLQRVAHQKAIDIHRAYKELQRS
jgi:uncharacterized membrane protein YkvA (DUF1232 family)